MKGAGEAMLSVMASHFLTYHPRFLSAQRESSRNA